MHSSRPDLPGASSWLGRRLHAGDLRHDGNAFTAMRWLLASAVMFSHGYDLTLPERGLDPTVAWLSFPVAALAVYMFFMLSGFLVSGSLAKRGAGSFAAARGLRLIPGLWVMLLVTTLGLWAIFTPMPLLDFLKHPATMRYVGRNAALLGGGYTLPGVFPENQLPGLVNGSLWTITWEVRCYILLALVGVTGLLGSRRLFTGFFLAAATVHMAVPIGIVTSLGNPRKLAFAFFIGVLAYLWRDKLRLSWPLALLGVAASLLLPPVGLLKMTALQVSFAYLVLVAAFCVPQSCKRASAALPDYSYGIYIYAFPMQQLALAVGIGTTPLANMSSAWLMTLPLAALSWHLVEKPALGFKPAARTRRTKPRTQPDKVSENFTAQLNQDSLIP